MQETLGPLTSESVAIVIFNEEKTAVLLIKRRDIPVWVLPGGGIEKEETASEAAIREAKEETGFMIELIRQVAHYVPENALSRPTALFEAKVLSGTASTGKETRAIGFFSLSALPKALPRFYRSWIEDAQSIAFDHCPIIKKIQYTSYWTFLLYLATHPILVFRFLLTKMGIHLNSFD